MKLFFKLTSSLSLNLFLFIALAQNSNPLISDNYIQNSIQRSIATLSSEGDTVAVVSDHEHNKVQISALRAPNSYVYDINLAKDNSYAGLLIPVQKAFDVWASQDWFLNSPLSGNGVLSAFVYWEDSPGLIQRVEMQDSQPINFSRIKVFINSSMKEGNAVISLHLGNNGNQNDQIIWSWHVWVTDDPSNGISFGQGIETDKLGNSFTPHFMDRNLGATSANMLDHDWHKAGGLLYEWGRKDPIPSFVTRDFTFYELNGLIGNMRNREGQHQENILPEIMRPFSSISQNIKFTIQNPIAYILNSDNGTWFSSNQYRVMDDPTTGTNETIAWDLWSDNMRGENSNASSSNPIIRADSRSYEAKSPYDPCPNGWRIPSHLGRQTVNNFHSPWGRKNSGYNDDTNPALHEFYPHQTNQAMVDVKVYNGLGIDFSEAHNANGDSRRIGHFPNSGYYVYYQNNNPTIVFQDEDAQSLLWSATYSLGGARHLKIISDPNRFDVSEYGLNEILINQTTTSKEALPVRCIEDPNLAITGNFDTEYFKYQTPPFTVGLDNPNSYIVFEQSNLSIPVSKAFSIHQYLFPNDDPLPITNLVANVYWTDNTALVQSVSVQSNGNDPKFSSIEVQIGPNQNGNAVISLHNGSIDNPALWSWHIWAVGSEIEELTYVNQNILPAQYNFVNSTSTGQVPLTTTFMDRNLGAVYALPTELLTNPSNSQLVNEMKLSGGLHYQWGRKDPIPSFQRVGNLESYEIFKGIAVQQNGTVQFQSVNTLNYQNQYTKVYDVYKLEAGITEQDLKHEAANKIINYSIENPLSFLHQNTTELSDWVSDELSVYAERWGHGTSKSIFDPCPEGWRVPDTYQVYENGHGNSPWFNGKLAGSNQGTPSSLENAYGGQFFTLNNLAVGWFFNDVNFQVGSFPTTGIIGKFSSSEIGGTTVNQAITGLWTSSLTQQMKGNALGMTMGRIGGSSHQVISTGNLSPTFGMNVRCAKDEIRYNGELGIDSFRMNSRVFKDNDMDENITFYPNPVIQFLNSNVDIDWVVELYDLQGRMVTIGKFANRKFDLTTVKKGIYIGLITNPKTQKTVKLKIIKE